LRGTSRLLADKCAPGPGILFLSRESWEEGYGGLVKDKKMGGFFLSSERQRFRGERVEVDEFEKVWKGLCREPLRIHKGMKVRNLKKPPDQGVRGEGGGGFLKERTWGVPAWHGGPRHGGRRKERGKWGSGAVIG